MPGMGPPPKAAGTRRRRNPSIAMTMLPAAGRTGATPTWPLGDDIGMQVRQEMAEAKASDLRDEMETCEDKRSLRSLERQYEAANLAATILERQIAALRVEELALWTELWTTPQATVWEKLAWNREVAQYVRWKVRGELGDMDAAKEARQWSDRLGLNPLAMLRLRLEVEAVEPVADLDAQRRKAPVRKKAVAAKDDPRQVLRAVN